MGILRKLAELVVEFPGEDQPAVSDSGQNVLDSIEQIRADLESDLKLGREAFAESAPSGTESPDTPSPAAGEHPDVRLPAVLGVSDIYARAGLASMPESFDVYHVQRMLEDPEIADLPLETRAKSVRMALRSMGRELSDLIADAGRRDQALETYEQFLTEAIADISRQVSEANAAMQMEIDAFVRSKTARIEANQAAQSQARDSLLGFRNAKSVEERKLFNIVAPFVAPGHNPVLISGVDPPAQPKGGKQ